MKSVEGCKMCERLNREYPVKDSTPEELMKRYFPNAIIRGNTIPTTPVYGHGIEHEADL